MYIHNPIKPHNLIQPIPTLNPLFKHKPPPLILHYLPIPQTLKQPLKQYTQSHQPQTPIHTHKPLQLIFINYHLIQHILYNLHYSKFNSHNNSEPYYPISHTIHYLIPLPQHQPQPFIKTLTDLTNPFPLSPTQPTPQHLNHQIPFFKPLKPPLLKFFQPPKQAKIPKTPAHIQAQINQLLS
ncbi:type I restriction enzyme endonuclease domain-containing protein, partial [Staphylococcus capitis]|uniref:type I restriction enzyme endonuclease domain-containing protein n=1 Tax=Staphylococcus capitis TaxID=29388 RepID=UPI001C92DF37